VKVRKFAILNKFFGREPLDEDLIGIPEIFTDDNLTINLALKDEIEFLVIGQNSDYFISKQKSDLVIEKFPKVIASKPSNESKVKGREIRNAMSADFFDNHLRVAIASSERGLNPLDDPGLTSDSADYLRAIYGNIDGEKGRALYLWCLALAGVKEVYPEQDIRLHKPSVWRDAVSMRTIASETVGHWFINNSSNVTVNPFGPAMTRSFAVNLPWVTCWTENIKGPRDEWLQIIDQLHYNRIRPYSVIRALLYLDYVANQRFDQLSEELQGIIGKDSYSIAPIRVLQRHIRERSNGGARLLEVAIHSLMQCAYENNLKIPHIDATRAPDEIKSMRSADRKAGGIGDIQFRHSQWKNRRGQRFFEYAIDAKHDISEISHEINRLLESVNHPETPQPHLLGVDFVGLDKPIILENTDTNSSIERLTQMQVRVRAISLSELADEIDPEGEIRINWLRRYASMLMKEDNGYGIMSEITYDWLDTLFSLVENIDL